MSEILPFNSGFSPDRFRRYAKDLERAIFAMSEEYRSDMGSEAKLREALGSDNVKVRYGNGKQYVTMDEKTVELPADASPEDVAKALNVTPMPPVNLVEESKQDAPAPAAPVLLPTPAKPTQPISKNRTGAGYFASLIREQQAALKEQFAKAGEDMKSAMGEMKELADAATQEAKHVMAEAADLRAALGMNSNGGDE
jgi:hypothetical protein